MSFMRNSCKYSVGSDNDSGLSTGKEFSSFSSNHSTTQHSHHEISYKESIFIKIYIPDLSKHVKYEFSARNSVFDIKRVILKRYSSKLVDPINYGLFIPHKLDKAGKFLQDERLLGEYCSGNSINNLEFIYKHRIIWPDKSDEDVQRKINSKVNHNRFIDYIIRNDPAKVRKALEKGLDPNFHCSSGETPLTLTAKLAKSIEIVIALVSGGAHLDYRSTDSLTPLHKAAISGNYETLSTLLDFGASPNCVDAQCLTPLYYNLLYDNSTKCLEKLLYEYAKLGVVDKRGLKEIHQASRSGKTDHLDILLAYGADINSRTENHQSTPLHVAAYTGQEDCVRLLLLRGADRTLVNNAGRTAIQEARMTSYKNISNMIKDFKDSEIHTQPSFKQVFNIKRKKSEFDITSAHLKIRNVNKIENNESSRSSERSRKKILHKKPDSSGRLKERCSSQSALSKSVNYNIYSDPDDTSASSDLRSQTNSNKEKSKYTRNGWRHSSMLSLDSNNSISDSEASYMREVVLQKSSNSGYGIDLDDTLMDPMRPSTYVIKNVEIGSPAFLAGIRGEDYLLEINGVDVRKANIQTIQQLFSQNKESVVLKVYQSNKYSDASTDPSLHYEQFAYQHNQPIRSCASVDFETYSQLTYNLSCLVSSKNRICESSTTLNSVSTLLANGPELQTAVSRTTLRDMSPAGVATGEKEFNNSSDNLDKCLTLGRKRSQSTDKRYQKYPLSKNDALLKYRAPLTPGINMNTNSLKPILKNASTSYGVRENVAKVKSMVQSPLHPEHEFIPFTEGVSSPPISLSASGTHSKCPPPIPVRQNFRNKSLPQSNSFDTSVISRAYPTQIYRGSVRPILTNKEPSVCKVANRDSSYLKVSTSEEDFCLPPPISFQ